MAVNYGPQQGSVPGAGAGRLRRVARDLPRGQRRGGRLGLPGADDGDGRARRRARKPVLRSPRCSSATTGDGPAPSSSRARRAAIGAAIAERLQAGRAGRVHGASTVGGRRSLDARGQPRQSSTRQLERFDGRLDAGRRERGVPARVAAPRLSRDQWDKLQGAPRGRAPSCSRKYSWDALERHPATGRFLAGRGGARASSPSPFQGPAYVAAKHGVLGLVKVPPRSERPPDAGISAVRALPRVYAHGDRPSGSSEES